MNFSKKNNKAKSKICFALLSTLVLQGCVWSGYQMRPENAALYGENPGPVASLQNLQGSEFESPAIEALEVAARVVDHQDYAHLLKDRQLRVSCASDERISGLAALDDLKRALDFSLVARKPFRANAVTEIWNQRIAIRKSRYRGWDGNTDERAAFINTLVHETTHMIPETGYIGDVRDASSRYRDKGHGTDACPDNELVSYELGRIAGEVYKEHHAELNKATP